MPEIIYSIDAKVIPTEKTILPIDIKISPYEWFMLQEHRRLQRHGGGDLLVTVVDGMDVGFKMSFTQKRENLLKLQTQT
jgi:hypothetical protein